MFPSRMAAARGYNNLTLLLLRYLKMDLVSLVQCPVATLDSDIAPLESHLAGGERTLLLFVRNFA